MRNTVLSSVIGLGVVIFGTGGVYHHFSTRVPEETVAPSAPAPETTQEPSAKGFTFTAVDRPKPVPELKLVDGEGREMSLEAFRGQTVLLNIWATWCVPCRKEMPALDRLQARLGGPDFQVVPLSIDREGVPAVKVFYAELGLQALGIYVDQSGRAAAELGAVGIPTTLLVGRNGMELGRTIGPAEWDSDEVVRVLKQHIGPRALVSGQAEGEK